MFKAAIKCDFCGVVQEIDGGETPSGWATVGSIITIKGTVQGPNGDDYRRIRNELRKKFVKTHICVACVELTVNGKTSIKIGMEQPLCH